MRLILLQLFFLSIGTAFSQVDCNKYPKDYIPKDLDDALSYLDCKWTEKETFKNKTEKDAVADAHFSEGQWIRNDWELWEGKNLLCRQFKSLGVTFPEDISTIVLTSFHRRLNNKDIDLDGQVKEYKDYRQRQELARLERNKLAKKLTTGDTVSIVFSRNQSTKNRYTLALLNYESSVDEPTNCIIQGQIKKKRKVKGSAILTIEITSNNNCYSSYYQNEEMVKGQIFSYNMTYFNLRVVH